LHLSSDDRTRRMDLDRLRDDVESWFEPAALREVLGQPAGQADEVAREWLGRAGKRWRPFLTVCAYKAHQDDPSAPVPASVRRIGVAVECFHKASLIHDDIEDNDAARYGRQALHVEYGLPIALNAGDLLIGEGYRLLAECDAPASVRATLLGIAAEGQRQLCLGQGAELEWARHPRPLTSAEVIEIFRRKTSPAFEVALRLGAAHGGAGQEVHPSLARYSDALGVAYQIRDDLEDLADSGPLNDFAEMRPWLPMAIAYERATGSAKDVLRRVWEKAPDRADAADMRRIVAEVGADARCRTLLEMYKEQAIRTLPELQNTSLKGLLRRVIGKIFRIEIKGWCSEFEARNAADRTRRAAAAG